MMLSVFNCCVSVIGCCGKCCSCCVVVIQVGNGKRSVDDSIDVVDPVYHGEEDVMEGEGDMSGETQWRMLAEDIGDLFDIDEQLYMS